MARSKKATSRFNITDYYKKSMSLEDMQKERRRLAKVVNQRMRRAHAAVSEVTGERYDEWGAIIFVKDYLKGEGRELFSENLNYTKDYAKLRRELTILKSFEISGSGTVGKQKAIEKRRFDKFSSGNWGGAPDEEGNKKGGRRKLKYASNKQFYDFLNSQLYKSMLKMMPSEEIIELYDMAKEKHGGDEEKALEELEDIYQAYVEDSNFGFNDAIKKLHPMENSGNKGSSPKKSGTNGRRKSTSKGRKRKK